MAIFTLYTLEASDISVTGGQSLGNMDQGNASHLDGEFITLLSNDWRTVEVDDSDNNFNDSDNSQTLVGNIVYNGQSFADGQRVEAEYTLTVEDPDGERYTLIGFNINEPGVTSFTTVEGLAFIGPIGGFPPRNVPLEVVGTAEGPAGAATPYSTYATPPCFTAGTLIRTPHGVRPVETLRPGDRVCLAHGGTAELRWIGCTTLPPDVLFARPRLRPVSFAPGSLGPGLPSQPFACSPQHRILLGDWRSALLLAEDEVLVPARHLCNGTTIRQEVPAEGVTYVHLLFDRHELIETCGLVTESFQPGPESLAGLAAVARDELIALFPDLALGLRPLRAARPTLRRGESRLLAPHLL